MNKKEVMAYVQSKAMRWISENIGMVSVEEGIRDLRDHLNDGIGDYWNVDSIECSTGAVGFVISDPEDRKKNFFDEVSEPISDAAIGSVDKLLSEAKENPGTVVYGVTPNLLTENPFSMGSAVGKAVDAEFEDAPLKPNCGETPPESLRIHDISLVEHPTFGKRPDGIWVRDSYIRTEAVSRVEKSKARELAQNMSDNGFIEPQQVDKQTQEIQTWDEKAYDACRKLVGNFHPTPQDISTPDHSEPLSLPEKQRDGMDCAKCGNFYPYAEPNQEDGTMICYACRAGV